MGMHVTRRDILKLAAGGAVGFLLTPMPWKLLGDSAVWTQNWPWIPRPARGESISKFTVCTLCPAACPVRARCIGGQPVYLSGIPRQSAGYQPLCPIGIAGHQLPFHPSRLTEPVNLVRHGDRIEPVPVGLNEVIAEIRETILAKDAGRTRIAIFDQQPHRAISSLYRQFIGNQPDGLYVIPYRGSSPLAHSFHSMVDDQSGLEFSYDFDHAAQIVSLGVPLVDFWQTRGFIAKRVHSSSPAGEEKNLHITQIEPTYSRTAAIADEWIPLQPGSEAALALGFAHILLRDKLCDESGIQSSCVDFRDKSGASYTDLVNQFPPERVFRISGVSVETMTRIAHDMALRKPAIVLGWCSSIVGSGSIRKEIAIAGLNILIGSMGSNGGVFQTGSGSPGEQYGPVTALGEIPDGSLRLIILDPAESGLAIPWESIERKLHPQKGMIVSLSPYLAGCAVHAKYIIPSPAYLETVGDGVSVMPDGQTAVRISAPLRAAPPKAIEPVSFLETLAASLGVPSPTGGLNQKAILCKQLAGLQGKEQGTLVSFGDALAIDMKGVASPEELFDRMLNGAGMMYAEQKLPAPGPRFSLLGRSADACKEMLAAALDIHVPDETSGYPLIALHPAEEGWNENLPLPPALTKLYQESDLRPGAHQARVHPETARRFRLTDGESEGIATANRTQTASVSLDSSVMPGIVVISNGPEIPGRSNIHDNGSTHSLIGAGNEPAEVLPATLTSVRR